GPVLQPGRQRVDDARIGALSERDFDLALLERHRPHLALERHAHQDVALGGGEGNQVLVAGNGGERRLHRRRRLLRHGDRLRYGDRRGLRLLEAQGGGATTTTGRATWRQRRGRGGRRRRLVGEPCNHFVGARQVGSIGEPDQRHLGGLQTVVGL